MKCHVPKRGYTGILKYFSAAGTSRRFKWNLVQSEIHSQHVCTNGIGDIILGEHMPRRGSGT